MTGTTQRTVSLIVLERADGLGWHVLQFVGAFRHADLWTRPSWVLVPDRQPVSELQAALLVTKAQRHFGLQNVLVLRHRGMALPDWCAGHRIVGDRLWQPGETEAASAAGKEQA